MNRWPAGRSRFTEPKFDQLRTLAELQMEDEALFVHADDARVEHLQQHLRLWHEVVAGDLTVADAIRELRALAL